jgi:hypothetical protein
VAFRIAGLFWSRNGLNELADEVSADAFTRITRRINGGVNGLADRQRFYGVARAVLGVAVTRGLRPRGLRAPAGEFEPFGRGAEAIRRLARRSRATEDAPVPAQPRRRAAKKK